MIYQFEHEEIKQCEYCKLCDLDYDWCNMQSCLIDKYESPKVNNCPLVAISKTETTSEEDDTYSQCEECGQFYLDSRGYDYCPKCGRKIGEATEEIIVPAMTAEEENILREIAEWQNNWEALGLTNNGTIYAISKVDKYYADIPFGNKDKGSKAYEVLAPILEKYGEINLDEYREKINE